MSNESISRDQADDVHDVSITITGLKDADAAKKLLAHLLGKDGEEVTIEEPAFAMSQAIGGGFTFTFPVCCWTSRGRNVWGICNMPTPTCSYRGEGCPA